MNIPYFVDSGSFKEEKGKLLFCGKEEDVTSRSTGETKRKNTWGSVLFATPFKSGKISFDVTFENANSGSVCGIVFDYKNINQQEFFYQFVIRNQLNFWGLDYYNGGKWEYRASGGTNNSIAIRKKYNISIDIQGNIVKFFINDVHLYTYSNFVSSAKVCGLTVCNNAKVIIENIKIKTKLPKVFSIMKFEKDFDELYSDVIVPKCEQFGYKAIRADECYTTTAIIQDITQEITDASIIIADVTMDNPNVFYELGYAHALKKPTILLADVEKREKLPFDISGQRVVFYNNSIGGKKDVEKKLEKYFENINENDHR